MITNSHQHSTGSDGTLTPEQVVQEAINQGIKHLCFTDHYPLPEEMNHEFQKQRKQRFSEEYVQEVKRVTEKYKDRIDVCFGAEFDWISKFERLIKLETKKRDFDFLLGSVHFIVSGEDYLLIPYSDETLLGVSKKFDNFKDYVKEYYAQMRLMVRSGLFDCVSHFDFIKKLNKNSAQFSENDDWYTEEVILTLNEIAKSGMCMELSSAGWREPRNEQYPAEWILREMKKRNIPITVGSDGHKEVGRGLKEVVEIAKKAGYQSSLIFKNRKPIEVKL